MSPQAFPPWMSNPPWSAGYHARRRAGFNPDLRVSDAERADVADRLSKHYGDGRLDQSEFNERMERIASGRPQRPMRVGTDRTASGRPFALKR